MTLLVRDGFYKANISQRNFGGPEKDRFDGFDWFVEMQLNHQIRRGFGLGA